MILSDLGAESAGFMTVQYALLGNSLVYHVRTPVLAEAKSAQVRVYYFLPAAG